MTLFQQQKNMKNEFQRHLKHDSFFSMELCLRDGNWFFFASICLLATIIIYELFFSRFSLCMSLYWWVFVHLIHFFAVSKHVSERTRKQKKRETYQNVNGFFCLRTFFPGSILMVKILVFFHYIFFSDIWIFFYSKAYAFKTKFKRNINGIVDFYTNYFGHLGCSKAIKWIPAFVYVFNFVVVALSFLLMRFFSNPNSHSVFHVR